MIQNKLLCDKEKFGENNFNWIKELKVFSHKKLLILTKILKFMYISLKNIISTNLIKNHNMSAHTAALNEVSSSNILYLMLIYSN